MPVFKNEGNGTWYVMARYVNWKGGAETEVQAWICHKAGGAGVGAEIPVTKFC